MRSFAPRFTPWLVLITLTAAGIAAAAGYGLTAAKRYRATAQLLVSPVPASDSTFTGINVLRDTSGKRTAASTAAALLRSPQVADAVRAQLGITRSRDSLLNVLHAHVVDGSNVVDVTVEDTSASSAAQLANAFADALVTQRSATFQSDVASAIRRDDALLAELPKNERQGAAGAELERRLAALRSLQAQPDPTLTRSSQATAPAAASWPKLSRLIEIGAGIGAVAGALLGLAFVAFRRRGGPASDEALETFVDRLEGRLTARESGLAARERDLQATLEELRVAQASESKGDVGLARRERGLEERVQTLTKRELELARRAAELVRGTAGLEHRIAEVADREQELVHREQELVHRERDAAEASAREPEPAAPTPEAAPPPASSDGSPGRYNLLDLEARVEEQGSRYPDRVEEWSSYLFFLRDHASADGTVPASFDWLIEDTFAELVE